MAASRATTTGTGHNDSALYFTGPNLNKQRITDIKYKKAMSTGSRQMYKKVALREKWVQRLESHTYRPDLTPFQVNNMQQWCNKTTLNVQTLDKALSRKGWRKNMCKDVNY